MNYFEFYNIPLGFLVDAAALKRTFYANSKRYHPDFFTLEDEGKQAEVLELSTLNNKAYQTLNDFDRRMKYVLELKGVLAEEGSNEIPQDFLMDMMEINEALMELEFDFDEAAFKGVKDRIEAVEKDLYGNIAEIVEHYEEARSSAADLEKVKEYYLKKRYLLRISENLDKFAGGN